MAVRTTVLLGNAVSQNPLPTCQNPSVVLRGEYNGKPASFGLDASILSKHMMLVGGTGCGKSTLFYHLIEQTRKSMTKDDVMIVFDSKGDFYSKFYRPGDAVIGNSKQYRDTSEHWNIYKEILADGWDDREVLLNAQEICKGIFEERTKKSGNNPFFPNAARDLLAAILVVFIRMGNADKDFVKEFFYNKNLKEWLDGCTAQSIYSLLRDVDDMQAVLSYIGGSGNNNVDGDEDEDEIHVGEQALGVLSELFSVIRDIFIGVFAEQGGFSIRNFVRKKGGRALFIEYDLAIGSVLTPIYKLLFDLALKEALGRSKSQGNVYFFCDEFKLLPNLGHIDDAVNFGRSLGVKVFAGIQSIEQLFEIYGESRGKNLAAGFSTIIAFRANDVSTRQYMSNLYGKNIVLEQYRKIDNTMVEEKRDGSTVEDWDMNSLRVGEAIVSLPFTNPFRFYFDMYNK